MNPWFQKLHEAAQQAVGLSERALLDALFLIRAPYHLKGIQECCRRLDALARKHPAMLEEPAVVDIAKHFATYRQIAALEGLDAHFSQNIAPSESSIRTPLRPYTGDSGICDLLLLDVEDDNPVQHQHFECVLVWFFWQVSHHQVLRHKHQDYANYLHQREEQKLRLNQGSSVRIYSTFSALSKLADPSNQALAQRVAALFGEPSIASSKQLARLLKGFLSERGGQAKPFPLRDQLIEKETILALNQAFQTPTGTQFDLQDIKRLLSLIWGNKETHTRSDGYISSSYGKKRLEHIQAKRYKSGVSLVTQPVDAEHEEKGALSDIYLQDPDKGQTLGLEQEDAETDDAFELPVEPSFQIYLGTGDPLAAWYQAKSAAHHIELNNAQLAWPKHRLSNTAVNAVLALVTSPASNDADTNWARLALGVGLITGRAIGQFEITLSGESDAAIQIDPDSRVVTIKTAKPALKDEAFKQQASRHYFEEWVDALQQRLPETWSPLLARIPSEARCPQAKTLRSTAQSLLDTLPTYLEVSLNAVARHMQLRLLAVSHDDLAFAKLISDAELANATNMLHYASFRKQDVERLWREAAYPIELEAVDDAAHIHARTGAAQGVSPYWIEKRITTLKEAFTVAVQRQDWIKAYNVSCLYTALWMGVATAGRGVSNPVPTVITSERWAIVQDKHRADASTDRYVPLSDAVCAQLTTHLALTDALRFVHPEFEQLSAGNPQCVPLFFFEKGTTSATTYRVKHRREAAEIRDLVGNFGRKLVRSWPHQLKEAPLIPARFKDAGLGHWARGRHAWAMTSSFPVKQFREQWLALQNKLEQDLGLLPLHLDAYLPRQIVRSQSIRFTRALSVGDAANTPVLTKAKPPAPPTIPSDVLEAELREASVYKAYEAVFEADPPDPQAARELVYLALMRRQTHNRPVTLAVTQAYCDFIRTKTGIPIFATAPRARFQHNWMVDQRAFYALAYVEQDLLGAIERDLSHLPEPESDVLISIGRLLTALSLRGGVLSSRHLDSLLLHLAKPVPIEGIGAARVIAFKVRSERTRASMRRTLFLTPYLSSLLLCEAVRVQPWLQTAYLERLSQPSLRAKLRERAFRRYLRSLGVSTQLSLAQWLAACRQRLMLHSTPLLAAYASGELQTDDLPITELRRLAGLKPTTDDAGAMGIDADALVRSESEDEGELTLPSDLRKPSVNFVRLLCGFQSSLASEWERKITLVLKKQTAPIKVLLCNFALHLVQTYAPESTAGHTYRGDFKLKKREQKNIQKHLHVVWAGLLLYAEQAPDWSLINDTVLIRLADLTESLFKARQHHGAWARFNHFLQSKALHGPFEVGAISSPKSSVVSAKILSGQEVDRLVALIPYAQSGIYTPQTRQFAKNLFQIAYATGARRAEVQGLRSIDFDGDMLRIRTYEGRTLKTAASERVVPLAMIPKAHLQALYAQDQVNNGSLFALSSDDAFYDKLAKAMKLATGDRDIGLHHLRHTKASMLLLRMLANIVPLHLLQHELPWLNSSLPPVQEVELLLGKAGQTGQSTKAIAALLGHLHETTTIKHYVHTLGIALHAHYLGESNTDFALAFRRRMSAASTLYRHRKAYQEEARHDFEQTQKYRDMLESMFLKAASTAGIATDTLLHIDQTPHELALDTAIATPSSLPENPQGWSVTYFEKLQACFLGERTDMPEDINSISQRLHAIAAIPTRKRRPNVASMHVVPEGKKTQSQNVTEDKRHHMPLKGKDGTPLPKLLLPGKQVAHAEAVLAWLAWIHQQDPKCFTWLMHAWRHTSNARSGKMPLKSGRDVEMAAQLHALTHVYQTQHSLKHVIHLAPLNEEASTNTRELLIWVEDIRGKSPDAQPARGGRNAGAVRWVMTWVMAIAMVSE